MPFRVYYALQVTKRWVRIAGINFKTLVLLRTKADNTWLSFISCNRSVADSCIFSGHRGKAAGPCRHSGSEKQESLSFLLAGHPYRTDRRPFAIPGSQAPFRDVRVPESWKQAENKELPAFLHSHAFRDRLPSPGCFRQNIHMSAPDSHACAGSLHAAHREKASVWGRMIRKFRQAFPGPDAVYRRRAHCIYRQNGFLCSSVRQ